MKKKTGCAIISGGKGTRLGGRDKSQIIIKGRTILERLTGELSDFDELIMAGGNREHAQRLGLSYVPDSFPGSGPMSGIYSALKAAESERLFVAACDMPFLKKELVNFIINEYERRGCPKALIVKAGGFLQPLCSIYSKEALPDLEAALMTNRLKLSLFALEQNYPVCEVPTEYAAMFANINDNSTLERTADKF